MSKAKKKQKTMEELLEEALVPEEEQPYKVPENWVWVRLGSISEIIRGVSYKKHQVTTDLNDSNAFIIRGGNIQDGKIVNQKDNVYVPKELVRNEQFIRKGDVVIVSSTGSSKVIGKPGIIKEDDEDTSFGAFITMIRPNEGIHYSYFGMYFLSHLYREKIVSLAKGSNINNIKKEHLTQLTMPVPNVNEQIRIADKAGRLLYKIDEAKRFIEEAKETFELRRAAILDKAFRGELTEEWRKENPEVRLPRISDSALAEAPYDIPSEWKWVRLGDVCSLLSGKGFKKAEYTDEGVKLLKIQNVSYRKIDWSDVSCLPDHYLETEAKLVLHPQDILIALNRPITNNKLKVGMLKDEDTPAILYQRVGCLRPVSEELDPSFLYLLFTSGYFLNEIQKRLLGSDQPYINMPQLKEIPIPLVSYPEQKAIVESVHTFLKKEQKALGRVESSIDFESLQSSILSQAFRGELGTNEPAEESAIELLKKVLQNR
ncbi:restriction endonuclease subunit S [Siminovitchia sediminis]|uniref:Restriction endonuclease subunit S n=1 Tax=Siminovitchia sediminis TaxID=1274353 RepID=A0ABW4KLC4_9BACI